MRSGVCPKCSSHSIYAARGGMKYGTPGALVAHIEPGFKGIRPTQPAEGIWQFMCADCGYLESYALDDATLAFVREHWRANPPGDESH
jgi:predicted nucleic-acid-binding Zn-ribbon protein